jgi:hypothetical protein
MQQKHRRAIVGIIALVVSLSLGNSLAVAQTGMNSALVWHIIGSGGQPASEAEITLNGTIGQPIVGISTAPGISLSAGPWRAPALAQPRDDPPDPPPMPQDDGTVSLYLPLVVSPQQSLCTITRIWLSDGL